MVYETGVAAFIIDKNQLLMMRFRKPRFFGRWGVPSGKVETGEALEQAVKREVKEEVGLEVLECVEFGVNVNEEYAFESHLFVVKRYAGVANNCEVEKCFEVAWHELDNLPQTLDSSAGVGLKKLGYLS
jgi:8-oxo-dGTP diphosphatase